MATILHSRRGISLVELLVVIVILGLLTVSVGPLFLGNKDRRECSAAADVVALHINAAVARSIGSIDGDGVWLASPTGTPTAVTDLGFSRPRSNVTGELVVNGSVNGTASFSLPQSVPLTVPGLSSVKGVIHLAGLATPFELTSGTTFTFLPGYSKHNTVLPDSGDFRFRATVPPQRRMTAAVRRIPYDCAIDLAYSTIGVHGFTDPSSVNLLDYCETVAISFDCLGRPSIVWTKALAGDWDWHAIDQQLPVALLVGRLSQIGVPPVTNPTIDDPGANIQSPDAKWVVIDPKAQTVKTVPNNPASLVKDAQKYVQESLSQ